jgi:hypothetical protein
MTKVSDKPGFSDNHKNLADLVQEFLDTSNDCCNDDEYYSSLRTLDEAVQNAALAKTATGSVSSHQRQWVRSENMQRAMHVLLAAKESFTACKDFDVLMELVERVLRGIPGLGDLYYYDTSRRIGAFLGLFPKRVYLHRGTRDGAKALGLVYNKRYLNMVIFPVELRQLEPKQIEDFLCRYKDRLKSISR